MKVALGGTFNPLHDGHKALLRKVVELSKADEIVIGLTSDDMARERYRTVLSYTVRAENIKQYMKREYGVDVRIIELFDRFGITLDEEIDSIVVSPETVVVADEINELRKDRGCKAMKVIVVDHVLAEDGDIISSTRIKKGEIDKHGRLLE